MSLLQPRTLYLRFNAEESLLIDVSSGRESQIVPVIGLSRDGANEVVAEIGEVASGRRDLRLVKPFAHERVVLHEFEAAVALLRHQMFLVFGGRIHLRPRLVLHPKRTFETVLTDVEIRSLLELGLAAPASWVAVHTGPDLAPALVETTSYSWTAKAA